MNNVKVAKELIKIAHQIISKDEINLTEYKKHIKRSLEKQSTAVQTLYTWCQMHHNPSVNKLDIFEDLLNIKTTFENLIKKVEQIK